MTTTDLDHIDRLTAAPSGTWLIAAEPCAIQSRIDYIRRTVPAGTKARVQFAAGGTWAEMETGEPVVIDKHDLTKWDSA